MLIACWRDLTQKMLESIHRYHVTLTLDVLRQSLQVRFVDQVVDQEPLKVGHFLMHRQEVGAQTFSAYNNDM